MTEGVANKVTDPEFVKNTLDRAVQILIKEAHPKQIILFGSFARGKQTVHSDLDLLVIEDHPFNRVREMVRLRRALLPIPLPIDVLVYSEDDVRERGHWLGTALHDALSEGKTLYAAR